MTSSKDLDKNSYHLFGNLIDHNGLLLKETTYAIPVGDVAILDSKGNHQMELITFTFNQGEHIEEVRRGMQEWGNKQFAPYVNADYVFINLGFYELLSDGVFRKMVQTKGRLRG